MVFPVFFTCSGPATWAKAFPIANGKKQSPIDITPGTATFDAKLAGGISIGDCFLPLAIGNYIHYYYWNLKDFKMSSATYNV